MPTLSTPPGNYGGSETEWNSLNTRQQYKIINKDKIREQEALRYELNKDKLKELRDNPIQKERKSEYNQQYRVDNLESERQRCKDWRANNEETVSAYNKDYYDKNKESMLANGKEYKTQEDHKQRRKELDGNNRDHINTLSRAHHDENRERDNDLKRKNRHRRDAIFYEMFGEGPY